MILFVILLYSIDCIVLIVSVLKYCLCTQQYLQQYCFNICLIVFYHCCFIVYVIVHDIVRSYCWCSFSYCLYCFCYNFFEPNNTCNNIAVYLWYFLLLFLFYHLCYYSYFCDVILFTMFFYWFMLFNHKKYCSYFCNSKYNIVCTLGGLISSRNSASKLRGWSSSWPPSFEPVLSSQRPWQERMRSHGAFFTLCVRGVAQPKTEP
jgi:hypothetical protein